MKIDILFLIIIYFFSYSCFFDIFVDGFKVTDITTYSNNQYGDPGCTFLFSVLIESDNQYSFSSINVGDANIVFYTTYPNGNLIYQVKYDATAVVGINTPGYFTLSVLFFNGSTYSMENTVFQYYCEKPKNIQSAQISKFSFINKIFLVSYLKVLDFQKSNLPKLSIQAVSSGFVFLHITPIPYSSYYKIVAVVNQQYNMSNYTIVKLSFSNWGDIGAVTTSIGGPFTMYPLIETSKYIPQFYPNTSNFISNSAGLVSYNTYEFETNYPIPFIYDSSSSIKISSVLIGGRNLNNGVNNVWLTPYNIKTLNSFYTISIWDGKSYSFGAPSPTYTSKKFVEPPKNYAFLNGLLNSAYSPNPSKIFISETLSSIVITGQLSIPIAFMIFSDPNMHTLDKRTYIHQFYQPYPYGVDTSIVGSYYFKLTLVSSPLTVTGSTLSYLLGSTLNSNPPAVSADSLPPSISKLSITHLGNGFFQIDATIDDFGGSGFLEILFGDLKFISTLDFVSGDLYSVSNYQRIMRPPTQSIALGSVIKVFDQAGNFIQAPEYIGIQTTPTIKAPNDFSNTSTPYNPITITKFYFENPVMYVEKQGSWNSAYISFASTTSVYDLFFNYPYLVLQQLQLCDNVHFKKEIPFFWNDSMQMYQANFFIPSNFPNGTVDWIISTPLVDNYFSFEYFNFITMSQLKKLLVISDTFQTKPPIIKEMIVETPNVAYSESSAVNASWIMTLEDDSDLLIGYASIASHVNDQLNQTYTFSFQNLTITPNDAIDPETKKSYRLSIEIVCQNILYDILNITLINQRGYISQFLRGSSIYENSSSVTTTTIDPLFKIMEKNLTIVSTCSKNEPVNPGTFVIHSLTSSLTSVDVGSSNRTFTINILVSDINGIQSSQSPFIYLFGGLYGNNLLSFPTKPINFNFTHASFESLITVPYGFSFPNPILIEVFGVVNSFGRTKGWTINDFYFAKPPNVLRTISTTMSTNIPYISSTSQCYNHSKVITIYGKNFFSSYTLVSLESNNTATSIVPQTPIGVNSIVVNIQPTNNKFYIIVYLQSGLASNRYLIEPILFSVAPPPSFTPTPTESFEPTNPPQQCLGSPECGGPLQGYCKQGAGCICYSPYVGTTCSNKVIIIPPPIVNPINPSTNLTTNPPNGETNANEPSLIGIISFVSLRELDFESKVIKTHYFQSWELLANDGLNKNENYYKTNITTTTKNGGAETIYTTSITISTIWYEEKTNITFANQELIMNPSTLKYNINITTYEFESQLNTLQLVISTVATSNDANQDTCSNSEYGDTTLDNSNYIQLSVDTHSLYGRFIKRAILDGKLTSIGNTKLNDLSLENSYYTSNSYVGINIPSYKNLIQLDPDFSILLSTKVTNGICNSNDSGLSKNAIIGIVVGCVGFALVITISIILIIRYKYHLRNLKHIVKLNKINN